MTQGNEYSVGCTTQVSVVLPCLNEECSVGDCVTEALLALRIAGMIGEVIVVDNGSTDGSAAVAAQAGARVIREHRQGYGRALRTGFVAASGEIIVMADADMTYPLAKLNELVQPVARGEVDIMYGSRLDDATYRTMPPLHRWVGTPVLTFLMARACGGLELRDGQSGYRAFSRRTIESLDLQAPGMELNAEMLIKASRLGLRVEEVATGYRPRVGQSKLRTFADGWRNLRTIVLMAPDLLLIGPGLLLLTIGLAMLGVGFLSPAGLAIGSLRWQPVFFSSIATIVGVHGLLAGVKRRFDFVERRSFLDSCGVAGVVSVFIGLGIDMFLLWNWSAGSGTPSRGLAMAALAQSALVVGVVVATFSIIGRILLGRREVALVVIDSASELKTTTEMAMEE
jgi:CTP:molybdopterin cytidylyltransferase MocA